jgi:hypothetical protein
VPLREANEFRLDVDELEKLITPRTKMLIYNTPHNPTGGVLSRSDIERIAALAQKHDLLGAGRRDLCPHPVRGRAFSILSVPGMAERTILLDGHSKTFAMTGWRLGFGVAPREVTAMMAKFATNCNSCTASFVQKAGIAALEGPQEAVHIMLDEFQRRRDLIVDGPERDPGPALQSPARRVLCLPEHHRARQVVGTGRRSVAARSRRRVAFRDRVRCRRRRLSALLVRELAAQHSQGARAHPRHRRGRALTARRRAVPPSRSLARALGIGRFGVWAFVGAGGKSSTIRRLLGERPDAVATTTTHLDAAGFDIGLLAVAPDDANLEAMDAEVGALRPATFALGRKRGRLRAPGAAWLQRFFPAATARARARRSRRCTPPARQASRCERTAWPPVVLSGSVVLVGCEGARMHRSNRRRIDSRRSEAPASHGRAHLETMIERYIERSLPAPMTILLTGIDAGRWPLAQRLSSFATRAVKLRAQARTPCTVALASRRHTG